MNSELQDGKEIPQFPLCAAGSVRCHCSGLLLWCGFKHLPRNSCLLKVHAAKERKKKGKKTSNGALSFTHSPSVRRKYNNKETCSVALEQRQSSYSSLVKKSPLVKYMVLGMRMYSLGGQKPQMFVWLIWAGRFSQQKLNAMSYLLS